MSNRETVLSGDEIRLTPEGALNVPNNPIIPYIEGDGVGPELWATSRQVIDAAVESVHGGGKRIVWREVLAGKRAQLQTGERLPDATVRALKRHRVAIKGPLETPVGEGARSVNVALRRELDLYACVRPITYFQGIVAPVREPANVDMVIFRENTEDVYAGIEWPAGSEKANQLIEFLRREMGTHIRDNSGIGVKPISEFGTKRLVRKAIQFALDAGRDSVTLVHKGNIMKYTEGAFRHWGYELAAEEFGDATLTEETLRRECGGKLPAGKVLIKDRIADAMFQHALLRPQEYSVLAMPNLNGDYMSDALAAQVGGLGMAPGANIGDGVAVFEATHGTAPQLAGKDEANPCSLLLSGVMMLEYIGWGETAVTLRRAIGQVIGAGQVTVDLARLMDGAQAMGCSAFGQAIIDRL